MPETSQALPAPIEWAQRSNLVYLRIAVEDVKKPEVKVEKDKVIYKGMTGSPPKKYEANLDLFGEINVDESKWINRDRGAEFVLVKAVDGPYWKRLLKSDKKYHWLKVDFNKWRDEDDSDSENAGGGGGGGADFEDMMRQMGGLGGGMPDLGDLEDEKPDSDDDDLPDLEPSDEVAGGAGEATEGDKPKVADAPGTEETGAGAQAASA